MKKNKNIVYFVGELASDPQVYDSDPDKNPFCFGRIKIAEQNSRNPGETSDSYHTIKGFGKRLCDAFKGIFEGTQLEMYGHLRNRSFEVDGEDRWVTEVIIANGAKNFTILKAVTEPVDPVEGYDASGENEENVEDWVARENAQEDNSEFAPPDDQVEA